ncbi:hypothetical protein [Flexithrix dorotheae]|uniref:hypothetical protein n=1 Tax=Flexithrix dorotheae TaxID=70993 RepID=UPI0003A29663|nr:hypothetical protein [Flexithrix dorotheae]
MKIFYFFTVIFLLAFQCCMGQDNYHAELSLNKTFQKEVVSQQIDTTEFNQVTEIPLKASLPGNKEMENLKMVKAILEKENSRIFKSGLFAMESTNSSRNSDELQGEVLLILGQFISTILAIE